MARTISSSVIGPVILTTADNPLTITATGAVNSTGAGSDAIDGPSGTSWTIGNSGTITSSTGFGISLAGSGAVTNSNAISGKDGILLAAGGSVTNNVGGAISGTGALGGGASVGAGIDITGGAAMVTNNASIKGVAYGVTFGLGGTVTNLSTIAGGEDGVIVQGGTGTVSNSATISASVDDGVALFSGGSVTNGTGASITGAGTNGAGVFITGASGSVSNSGTISNPTHLGILLTGGGSVTNAAGGTILGSTAAVTFTTVAGTLTNAGTVSATGAAGADLEAGGTVNNTSGGLVSGNQFGVFVTGGSGTVTNAGKLTGATYDGVALSQGSVTNQATGSISGGHNGVYVGAGGAGTITNSGSIGATATGGSGVDLGDGGTVTNNGGGTISGNGAGVFATHAAGAVTNQGSITGNDGVALEAGGSVSNGTSASISGVTAGVFMAAASGTLSNSGTISATGGAGVDIEGGGSVSNVAGGAITGSSFGVFLTGSAGSVTNGGSIGTAGSIGIDLNAGGTVSNGGGGTIAGASVGVGIYGGSGTVTNAGTISGSTDAIKFSGAGANRVVLDPTGVFKGAVAGTSGAASNTIELAGGTGTLSGLAGGNGTVAEGGNSFAFTSFGALAVDTGGTWTTSGTNAVATIVDDGTIAVSGSLDASTAVDPSSTGLFQIGSGSTLEIAAALASGLKVAFAGNGDLTVDNAGSFGSNVGTASYAGPQLQDFVTGDAIDLKGFGSAGATFAYNSSTGVLQVTNGAGQVASLDFQAATLGSGVFQAATDGGGGTLLSLGAATPPPPPAVISGGTVGSGPDTLTVTLAEDAYQGDAQANVSLDGALLTATPITVTALHGAGASEVFTFKGTFGSGNHNVAVSFLNDAYGGSPSLDRNLYVDGLSLNGTSVTSGTVQYGANSSPATDPVELYSTGDTASYSVSGGTNPSAPTVISGGTVGSGPDTLTVTLAEDAYQGDAQANVSLDGALLTATPITVTALHGAGASEVFTFKGTFGSGNHNVAVSFLNDAYGGSPSLDRNLYVDGLSLNGTSVTSGTVQYGANSSPATDPVELYSTGDTASYSVSGGTNPSAPTVISGGTVGSGPDTLTVTLAEDAYQGDAQANVSLDGALLTATPITVTALHGAGASEVFTFKGTFGSGNHNVAVSFLNDAYGGSPSLDRNLYVDGLSLNGTSVTSGTVQYGANSSPATDPVELYSTGDTASYSVSGGTNPSAPTVISGGTVGSGPDTLTVTLAEDAYQGDAQANVSLDGALLTATPITVTALHGAGASEVFTFKGTFGSGNHNVAVSFLNDAYGGSPSLDRNLYVDGLSLNGTSVTSGTVQYGANSSPATDPVELYSTGDTASYSVSGGTNPSAPTVISGGTVGSGPDTLTVTLAEDAYQGDAQANVSLDGALLTATPITVTALHGAGASEVFTFKGTFGIGPHDLAVSFLNDAYGGSPSLDRNVYVDGATYDGAQVPNAAATLYTNSTVHFTVGVAPTS